MAWSLYPLETDPIPIVEEAGWATGPVWTGAGNLAPPRFNSKTVQPIQSCYTDKAILAPCLLITFGIRRNCPNNGRSQSFCKFTRRVII